MKITLASDVTTHGALIELIQHGDRLQIWIWTEMTCGRFDPSLLFVGTHEDTAVATYDAMCGKRRRLRSRDLHPSEDE